MMAFSSTITISQLPDLAHYRALLRQCAYPEEFLDFFYSHAEPVARLTGITSWPTCFSISTLLRKTDGDCSLFLWWIGDQNGAWMQALVRLGMIVRWYRTTPSAGTDAVFALPQNDFSLLSSILRLNTALR
jgi:hypothetical protein